MTACAAPDPSLPCDLSLLVIPSPKLYLLRRDGTSAPATLEIATLARELRFRTNFHARWTLRRLRRARLIAPDPAHAVLVVSDPPPPPPPLTGVQHRIVAASTLSKLWLNTRMAGDDVADVESVGIADLSFHEPEHARYRHLVDRSVSSSSGPAACPASVRPGMRWKRGPEASAAKVDAKLQRYARLCAR